MENNDKSKNESASFKSITELHLNKTGKVSNKWSSYLTYYDQVFLGIRNNSIKLLEIGVQNGGSLETWAKYFQNATKIVGCDIDEKCGVLKFDDERILMVVGEVNSVKILTELNKLGPWDVIIDDGSHRSEDILVGFLNYFPLLKSGGIYVIEDTHAVYQRTETGIKASWNVFSLFKDLTDIINFQFWSHEESIQKKLQVYLNTNPPSWLLEGWIDSIEFRNSMITIKKSEKAGHQKVGEITITGNIAEVDDTPLKVRAARQIK